MTTTAVPATGFAVPPVPQVPEGVVTSQTSAPQPGAQPTGNSQQQAPTAPPVAPRAPGAPGNAYNPASQQSQQQAPRALTQTEITALRLSGVPEEQLQQLQQGQRSQQPAPQVPQVPQVPTTPQAPEARPTGGLNDFDTNTIENPELKGLAEVLQLAAPGLDIERAMGTALAEGNPEYIDRAYLQEKLGAGADKIAKLAEKIVGVAAQEAQGIVQGVYQTAGGESNWQACIAAFNESAPDYLKYAAKQLLDSTATSKIMQGAKLVTDFAIQNGSVARAGGSSIVPQGGRASEQGVDKRTFQAELRKLDRNAPDFLEQRNQLFYRRQLGKNRGL